jgi:hypothetical protein
MPEVNDVDLMRLADGTLTEPRRSAVEAEVAAHPALQEQLEAYLATGKALAQLFGPIADAPVPERLLASIRPGASKPSMLLHRAAPHRKVQAASRLRDWFATVLQPDWRLSPMAAAAALTCVAAIGAAITLTEPQNTFVGDAPHALANALEKVPSYKKMAIVLEGADGATFTSDFSFRHQDGRFCRQYYLGLDHARAFVGFACSAGNGQWRVEKDAASPVRTASKVGDVRPLEGLTTAVDDAVNKVMVGDALEIAREHALIQQGWPREKQ